MPFLEPLRHILARNCRKLGARDWSRCKPALGAQNTDTFWNGDCVGETVTNAVQGLPVFMLSGTALASFDQMRGLEFCRADQEQATSAWSPAPAVRLRRVPEDTYTPKS